jgi:hypothetical protein
MKRRHWSAGVVLVLAVAASLLIGASAADAAEEGCFANGVCEYFKINFEERAGLVDNCEAAHTTTGGPWKSARNRCGNKSDWLRYNGTVIACMNPGGDRPNPGTFNEVFIPTNYGAFC